MASPWGVPAGSAPNTPERSAEQPALLQSPGSAAGSPAQQSALQVPPRSPQQLRADAFFAKLQGGTMTPAQQREAAELARIHCDYGAEEMRMAETHLDFAKAADWFRSSLRLNQNDDRAAAALEAAMAAEAALTPNELSQSPMVNVHANHFGARGTPGSPRSPSGSSGGSSADQMEAVRAQLERNRNLLDDGGDGGAGAAGWADAVDGIREETRAYLQNAIGVESSRLDGFELHIAKIEETVTGVLSLMEEVGAKNDAKAEMAAVKLANCEKAIEVLRAAPGDAAASPEAPAVAGTQRYRVDDGGGAAFRNTPSMEDRSNVAADPGMVIDVIDKRADASGAEWVQHTNSLWLPVSFLEPWPMAGAVARGAGGP